MKTHKFSRKPFYVDAVRVSEANIEEVAKWCDGEILAGNADVAGQPYIKVKVNRPLTDRQTQAFLGDWVLCAGFGFKIYTPKAFDKSFEKVKTLTKAQADEAGIKVPHEKRPPKPTRPQHLTTTIGEAVASPKRELYADDYKEPELSPIAEVIPNPDDEADALIAEVLNEKQD